MRWRALAGAYVLAVGALATAGFAAESTALILLATALGLPSSVAALVGYYVAYGLLAQVPGANGSDGVAAWFALTTATVGVAALVTAAVADVALVWLVSRARRSVQLPSD